MHRNFAKAALEQPGAARQMANLNKFKLRLNFFEFGILKIKLYFSLVNIYLKNLAVSV